MTKTMPMMEARNKLTSLPEDFEHEKNADVIAVTRRGKPVLAVLPWEFYETVAETLEILGDEKLMKELRRSIVELQRGKLVPWDRAKKELGI
jgi:antitoxin YefM